MNTQHDRTAAKAFRSMLARLKVDLKKLGIKLCLDDVGEVFCKCPACTKAEEEEMHQETCGKYR